MNTKKTYTLIAAVLAAALLLCACGNVAAPAPTQPIATVAPAAPVATPQTEAVVDDQAAADAVAALIVAIYGQQRTDDTDAQCAAAKAAWMP